MFVFLFEYIHHYCVLDKIMPAYQSSSRWQQVRHKKGQFCGLQTGMNSFESHTTKAFQGGPIVYKVCIWLIWPHQNLTAWKINVQLRSFSCTSDDNNFLNLIHTLSAELVAESKPPAPVYTTYMCCAPIKKYIRMKKYFTSFSQYFSSLF